jgi:hypothetical protein
MDFADRNGIVVINECAGKKNHQYFKLLIKYSKLIILCCTLITIQLLNSGYNLKNFSLVSLDHYFPHLSLSLFFSSRHYNYCLIDFKILKFIV